MIEYYQKWKLGTTMQPKITPTKLQKRNLVKQYCQT